MIELLETDFTYGDFPANPVASAVALEAGVSEAEAAAMIAASWTQAETFTRRAYRPILTGKLIVKVSQEAPYRWPRYPYPASLGVEVYLGGQWVEHSETYIPDAGLIELVPYTLYRLTQPDTVTPPAPAQHIVQAVKNLALYQLIHMPQRREFKNQSAGDTSLSREQLMGLFFGSGAGILLANEVRQ